MLAIFSFISLFVFSNVIQDDVLTTDKFSFPFSTVCQKLVSHDSPLIDIINSTTLSCMGTKIKVSHFCDKELAADPYYIRAWIDKEKRQVICQSGKRVLFKYLCVKLKDRQLCNGGPRKSCLHIKEKIAKRLDLVHSSQVKNEKGIKQLNCFFESVPFDESGYGKL